MNKIVLMIMCSVSVIAIVMITPMQTQLSLKVKSEAGVMNHSQILVMSSTMEEISNAAVTHLALKGRV